MEKDTCTYCGSEEHMLFPFDWRPLSGRERKWYRNYEIISPCEKFERMLKEVRENGS